MRADKISLFDLFEKQRRYLVPLFQRGYVWRRTDQWEPLWQDILDQVASLAEPVSPAYRPPRKHFLGAIVLNQAYTRILQVPSTEVIDGQQRLMTLQVLLAALRDAVAGILNPYLAGILERLTANPGPFLDPDEQFKVWPTGAYRDDLRGIIRAGSPEALANQYPQRYLRGRRVPPRPALVEAYLYFSDQIRRYLQGGELDGPPLPSVDFRSQRAEKLIEALTRRVQLVSIELDAEDDPQTIFETLNARGVPLEPSDLIRNFLFLYAVRHGEESERLYRQWWKEFDDAGPSTRGFWKESERQGRWKRSRLDLFLFYYLTFRTRRVFSITHLFQQFQDWWESSAQERVVERELEALHRSARVFKSLLVPEEGSPVGLFARRVRAVRPAAVYPLVLWLAERKSDLAEGEFEGMLEELESHLLRRATSASSSRSVHRAFVDLLDRLCQEEAPSRAVLRRELERMEMQGENRGPPPARPIAGPGPPAEPARPE